MSALKPLYAPKAFCIAAIAVISSPALAEEDPWQVTILPLWRQYKMLSVHKAVISSPALAEEDPWQAFEDRCLHPVSNVIMPNTENLETDGGMFQSPDGGWDMTYDLDRGEIFSCSIVTDRVEETLNAFREWAKIALETDSYREIPRQFLPDTTIEGYESHEWREPRIQVMVQQKKGLLRLIVEETDLEASLQIRDVTLPS